MVGNGTAVSENAPLVFNALESLSGTEDLITIRSRGRFKRPFEVIEKFEEELAEETRKEQELLNAEIEKYEQQLQGLFSGATKGDAQKLKDFATQQENLKTQLRKAQKRLRQLNADKRKHIESLQSSPEIRNGLAAPAMVLFVAVILALIRFFRARHYASRRTPQ